jgi:hypothetical protein
MVLVEGLDGSGDPRPCRLFGHSRNARGNPPGPGANEPAVAAPLVTNVPVYLIYNIQALSMANAAVWRLAFWLLAASGVRSQESGPEEPCVGSRSPDPW